MAPSVIVGRNEDGLFDTGDRLIQLFETRCPSSEIWGLVFSKNGSDVQLIKRELSSFMKNKFTAIHIPFTTNAIFP